VLFLSSIKLPGVSFLLILLFGIHARLSLLFHPSVSLRTSIMILHSFRCYPTSANARSTATLYPPNRPHLLGVLLLLLGLYRSLVQRTLRLLFP
jgi:hypothetical protein